VLHIRIGSVNASASLIVVLGLEAEQALRPLSSLCLFVSLSLYVHIYFK